MPDPVEQATLCFNDACRAARRKDSGRVTYHLTRLNEMDILKNIAERDEITIPEPGEVPVVEDLLPKWLQQVIRDEGLRLGEDLYLKKGPGTVGVEVEFRFK